MSVLAQAAEGITGNVTLGLAMIGGGLALGGGAIGAAIGWLARPPSARTEETFGRARVGHAR